MIGFGTLAVFVLAGLAGPALALSRRYFVPVTIGEIAAGIVVGPHVIGAVDPKVPTVAFLAEIGFAMLMLSVGMHLPLRDRRLLGSLRTGALLAAIVAALAVPAGFLAAVIAGGGHAAIYAVVLASGSAAVLLPALQEAHCDGHTALPVMAQVTIADVATVISIPIVLQPSRLSHAVLGTALVAAAAVSTVVLARAAARRPWAPAVRERSKSRAWALDLRLSLLVLFFLAWLAQEGGTSILIAGFGAGVAVAILGGPKRLSTQVRGVAEGFFVPLFFVVLGASLDVGALFSRPSLLALAGALAVLTVAIRLLAARIVRTPAAGALAASAQLGVPAAVSSLGLSLHVLSGATATAIIASALLSLVVGTAGVELIIREERAAAQTAAAAGSSSARGGRGTPAAA
ncbi:MAG TPA: cation:proton antiporter [Solirubrobacteraceae bacterium]|jgi:Kef-type K+ transport system membrane component KefB|nr:cation:proton antiporter [Solirubrobacteraceae bacterium]